MNEDEQITQIELTETEKKDAAIIVSKIISARSTLITRSYLLVAVTENMRLTKEVNAWREKAGVEKLKVFSKESLNL